MRESADASTLNPVSTSDELGGYIGTQLYQYLLAIDYETEKMVGIVVESAPEVVIDSTKKLKLRYKIRPEARFDNDRKITAEDVLFTIKLNVAPLIKNGNGKYYYGFIEDVIYSPESPDQFTIVCKNSSISNLFKSGDYALLPYEVYDKNRVLKNFTIDELLNNKELESNQSIIELAEQFNKKLTQTNPNSFIGSGPYRLKKWQKGERIILEKKKDWWGAELEGENVFFSANANLLQYEIINDPITAITALKSGQVDVMRSVTNNDFVKLKEGEKIGKKAKVRTGYQYIGFNLNDEVLKELSVRKAIEAALPLETIIEIVYKGLAVQNRLPIFVQQKELRNTSIKFQEYDLNKAKELLTAADWVDSDNNGILDKEIDGLRKELKLTYHFNTGNKERESVGMILKNELDKIGIELEVIGIEWLSYLKALNTNEVDLFMSGIVNLPLPPDFKSSFHSSQTNGGRNYANYQNPIVDSLIEAMSVEQNENKRIEQVKEFQRIVSEDIPYLFLLTNTTNIAFSKELKSVPAYSIRPGFWAPELY